MSITSDQYAIENSLQSDENNYLFENKQYIYVPDGQNGSYSSPQVTFECTQLTNSDRYIDFLQGFISVPLVLAISGPTTNSKPNAFALSLKNHYLQLINSIQVQISGNDVVTLSNLSNMKINYDILTSWSNDTATTYGQSIGFSGLDNWQSFQYFEAGAGNAGGLGETNNLLVPTNFAAGTQYLQTSSGNTGRLHRMLQNTSFDPVAAGSTTSSFFPTAANCGLTGKNYVDTVTGAATGTTYVYHILANIPLKEIHDLFKNIQLVKGMYMKLVLNLHTHCSVSLTTTAAPIYNNTVYSVSTVDNVVPFQISQLGGGLVLGAAVTVLTASIGIGKDYGTFSGYNHATMQQCRLYAPTYKMAPEMESKYLREVPQKTLLYNDFLTFSSQALNTVVGGQINPIITYGISRLRGILIVPQLASTSNGATVLTFGTSAPATTAGSTIGSPLISPFSSSPGTCAPWHRATNFNVFISGNAWYQQNINYSFEHFFNETRKNGAYGNSMPQIASGLIGQSDWEAGYGFIYVNLDRWANSAIDNAPKSVQVQLTNASKYNVDYFIYVIYQREITLSTSNGQLII